MARDSIMLSRSHVVGKSLREIYDLELNNQYVDWWVAVEPHPKSAHGVMESPVLAISSSIDRLVKFCNKREYLVNVTYEPVKAESPACFRRVA